MNASPTETSAGITAADRARVAARYPKKRSTLPLTVIGVVLAVSLTVWAYWTGSYRDNSEVSGQLFGYSVISDTQIDVVLRVHRDDPTKAATCDVKAQAPSGETVGELAVPIAPGGPNDSEVKASLKTYLRAHTAILGECRTA
ncbi:DUF4307 domain-containing protein [Propionibacteriaceae bacterium G1746]|uniref:DUF4307 domain-containing protein n=1 Tax=Aestuariimicrobium sp. G57 TaxID=3418485 RepID=UPI003C1C277F